MDDDRTLGGLADQPLDDVDAATLRQIRALYDATDPVPDDLATRIHFSLALDEMFDEVARMTRVPIDAMATRSDPSTGTRTETLTFSADRLTAMVTVSRVAPDRLRLDGWLAPPESFRVRLRIQDGGEHEVLADEQGRFSFDRLGEGFGQLSFHPVGDDEPENAVVTPLFQL
ncbi:hypothetical protein BH10ACT10_BH10ACT10_28660 [soil metagenome]